MIVIQIVASFDEQSSPMLIALSNTCRSLRVACSGLWFQHVRWRYKRGVKGLKKTLRKTGRTPREYLLSQLRHDCSCGRRGSFDSLLSRVFGRPICFRCVGLPQHELIDMARLRGTLRRH